ncbi:MAG: hypothetical protein GX471_17560 [Candidatus Microthrix parvicella]|nr:hypothetical protein [Candidatus Microthrix parvicella]
MTDTSDHSAFDLAFHWDPMCPFAWLTSKWVDQVVEQRGFSVDWRLISLRMLNADVNYDSTFPPEYIEGHTAGLQLLRVAAAVRDAEGPTPMRPLYRAMTAPLFECPPPGDGRTIPPAAEPDRVRSLLEACGLSSSYADALTDERWDKVIEADTEAALASTGRDVGTPIIRYQPPDGPAFFGPVISRVPDEDDAGPLWDAVLYLAQFPGFAELKRSLREPPNLPVFGPSPGDEG